MSENTFETNQNLEQPTRQESTEARALEDATHEPGARVEQTQDVSTAEAIEQVLTASMDQQETAAAAAGEVQLQETTIRDPLTDKGTGPGEDTSGSQNSTAETAAALDERTADEPEQNSSETVQAAGSESGKPETTNQTEQGSPAVELIDRDPVLDPDAEGQDPEVGGRVVIEPAKPDPEQLGPENKPLERERVIGHGPGGAVIPGAGKMPGGGNGPGGWNAPGEQPGGSSSSGGGAPVNDPTGETGKKPKEGDGYHSGSGPIGRWLLSQGMKTGKNYVEEPDGKGIWVMDKNGDWWYKETTGKSAPTKTPPKGDPMEGDQPMPYTGSGGGGGDPDPDGPRGGLDHGTGKVNPVLAGTGGGGKDGGGDSGGTPGDKDGDDDSGKFLASPDFSTDDVRPPDDDIPYDTLDVLNRKNLQQ